MIAWMWVACAPASSQPEVSAPEPVAEAPKTAPPAAVAEPQPPLPPVRARSAGRSPTDGCPATSDQLPASPLYEPDDPRLKGDALIVVRKDLRRIMVYDDGALATTADGDPACWWMGLASGYVPGHKQRQGDLRTPEGWWRTSDRPWSRFYSAITVHYPGPADAERGLQAGLITSDQRDAIVDAHRSRLLPPMNTRLGGMIVIHGGGGRSDWTLGCVAMDDDEIDGMRTLLPKNMATDLLVLP
ncbi:MAG: L,D-transpeptidase family protein [Myxococcales bacterium]|nr:L,D-transpeptidase family protein [Myxococcales bacterium]